MKNKNMILFPLVEERVESPSRARERWLVVVTSTKTKLKKNKNSKIENRVSEKGNTICIQPVYLSAIFTIIFLYFISIKSF